MVGDALADRQLLRSVEQAIDVAPVGLNGVRRHLQLGPEVDEEVGEELLGARGHEGSN